MLRLLKPRHLGIALKYLIAVPILIILCIGVFLQRSSHIWHRNSDGYVQRDGKAVVGSRLFKTHEGAYLIDLSDPNEWYAYSENEAWVGICYKPRGFSLFGVIYVSRDDTLPCVSYSTVKAEDPHLYRTDDYIEFDSRKGGRIRVVWHKP